MDLIYGTHHDHYQTILRAKSNSLNFIWSGDLRNQYLRENIDYAEKMEWVTLKFCENYEAQESGYLVKFNI